MKPRYWLALFSLAIVAAGYSLSWAWDGYFASLHPLDLATSERTSPEVLDRDGKLLRAFTMPDGRWRLPVSLPDIDPRFVAMLLAYEDHRFYEHHGVDLEALARAAAQFATRGRIVSGGSTLTMQVARLLEPRKERSAAAKVKQMARALQLEQQYAKPIILDLYFVLAPYGGNIEGVRAASLAYFGKEPKRLSVAEAALLVALPQAPEARRPDRFPARARTARDRVLERAYRRGVITLAERDEAMQQNVPHSRLAFPHLAPHAAEAALRADKEHGTHRLTLSAGWQAALERLAHESAQRLGPRISVAILVVDNATGEIRAHVGGADYFSASRAGAIDMTRALRSPGSALKPFIYALAFESGVAHPETVLDDRPVHFGQYAPEDFDLGFEGTVTARHALQMSLNLPAVELLNAVGPERFLARLRSAGADVELPEDQPPGLAIGLGGVGIKLTDLVKLYAGLARGGSVPTLHERVLGALASHARICEPVSAWYVADILRGAPPPDNAPYNRLAFKTGTSYGYRDAWAVGFDRRNTIGVWVGRPDNAAVPGLIGRVAAAPILFDAFARVGSSYEIIPKPADALVARTADLPPPLRQLSDDHAAEAGDGDTQALKIVYPPNGARVDLGLSAPDGSDLALKAEGGVPPFRWMVNGAPVGTPDPRRDSEWTPDGAGFARISVMDAKGQSDSVQVRLQ
ncbi:penicillin-binding protein 1C [Methylovirgula ligni]|uniref:peptidoglycan glycosyltransferase n=1 Tax=Methylovirgula ligni TaxID=569860 RepID=A0A3D9YYE6_9HYPH|nr:penicillin-binding protein 1C [Methylovirgula ligni]QAY94371.1 penicillin-binding protein 1C [Methylovirgula ligni]REF87784.1 penicillin-binding protein 1C [Methylovirgula ligni]